MATTAADVVAQASRLFTFIRTPAGEPYAIPRDGLRVALTLDQASTDLAAAFLDTGDIPGPQTMSSALTVLSALTRNSPVHEVYLRLARADGRTYLDLGRPDGLYVEIGPGGWAVRDPRIDPCPVMFTRSPGTGALPVPERGGSRQILADLLSLSTADDRWRQIWGWLTAQVLPDTARPMLYFHGSQGSGKTTRALMVANILEPQSELGSVLKGTERENNPVAKASYILTADNMTRVNEAISNWLCSLVTGHRVVERKLYTNAETIQYSLKRTGIFTGKVKPAGLASDAEERMIFLEFERMTVDRIRADDDLIADLREAHPLILGALLDDMAEVLRRLPTVDTRTTRGYRFVNFAKVFAALDEIDPEGYVDAITTAAAETMIEGVHNDPLLVALLRVVADSGGQWSGTAADLLAATMRFRPHDGPYVNRDVWWPGTAKQLTNAMDSALPALGLAGLTWQKRRSNGKRLLDLTLDPNEVPKWTAPDTIGDIEMTLRTGGRNDPGE